MRNLDTGVVDRRARRFMGTNPPPSEGELNGSKIKIVGSFAIGPDFENDGTVVIGELYFREIAARSARGAA